MKESTSVSLNADRPIADPTKDLLGVSEFAKNIANAISKMDASEGMVLSLEGPWGSGKSTIIQFILHDLEKNVTPIQFNPWWFSDKDQLAFYFFQEVAAGIGATNKNGKGFKKAAGLLRDASKVAGATGVPFAPAFAEFFNVVADRPDKDLMTIKQELEETLKKLNQRFLIVIDDLDRLTRDEMLQLFPLIKGVSNLPNIIYLLVFDRNVVIQTLNDNKVGSGSSYLDKIVQVSFAAPAISDIYLRKIATSEILNAIDEPQYAAQRPSLEIDSVRLLSLISAQIKTLRDVNRLVNIIRVFYPPVKDEVNKWQFVAIEAIRIFEPQLYEYLKNNRYRISGTISLDDAKKVLPGEHYHDLARELFPSLKLNPSDSSFDPEGYRSYLRGRFIHEREYVDVFFRFSLDYTQTPHSEIEKFIEISTDKDTIRTAVQQYFLQHPEQLLNALYQLEFPIRQLARLCTFKRHKTE